MEIIEFYNEAKKFVMSTQYKDEIKMCEDRGSFETCNSGTFFFEYVYVVLNAGMKEQVARKIYERFCKDLDIKTIGHLGKRKAVDEAIGKYKMWFNSLQMLKTNDERIEYLKTLPWIGDITKFHLARNIGMQCVKPDRHMKRLSDKFGFGTPLDMCIEIQKTTGDRFGVIDVILWRFMNLGGSKIIELKELK
jgi:hypothetical protein